MIPLVSPEPPQLAGELFKMKGFLEEAVASPVMIVFASPSKL
jgi:hypothetical protein